MEESLPQERVPRSMKSCRLGKFDTHSLAWRMADIQMAFGFMPRETRLSRTAGTSTRPYCPSYIPVNVCKLHNTW